MMCWHTFRGQCPAAHVSRSVQVSKFALLRLSAGQLKVICLICNLLYDDMLHRVAGLRKQGCLLSSLSSEDLRVACAVSWLVVACCCMDVHAGLSVQLLVCCSRRGWRQVLPICVNIVCWLSPAGFPLCFGLSQLCK